MKYTKEISLFRFTKFRDHNILIKRLRGAVAMCYMNGPYKNTRLVDSDRSRILPPQIGYTKHEDYTDWVPYKKLPDHVPEYQWFTYYKVMWEKRKNEV